MHGPRSRNPRICAAAAPGAGRFHPGGNKGGRGRTAGLFRSAPSRPARSEREIDLRIAEEVELAARHIEHLGAALVGDPAFLHRHGASLQALDLINQNLRHLASVVSAADKEAAAEEISLEELRRRLTRKSIRAIGG